MEILDRFKLLMEYDTKHTLTENKKIIYEITLPGIGNIAKGYIDDVFKNSGKVFKTAKNVKLNTADEFINALKSTGDDALNIAGQRFLKTSLLKNTNISLSSKSALITDLVSDPAVIKKYAKDTYDTILQKYTDAGFSDDVAQSIAKKLKPTKTTPKPNTGGKTNTGGNTNTGGKNNTSNQAQIDKAQQAKLAKQRAENAKLLSKQLNDEVYQLEKIVVDFENKTAKEVLKNPGLKQKVREAKNFLDDIKTKDLSVLSKYKQTQLNSLEATIKNANPGVYSEITNFIGKGWAGFRKLHWGVQALGVVLLVKFFGGKETGQILRKIWNGAKSLGGDILRGMGILDDPETTPENGTTPETTPETITTEAQLRAKYPCINGEVGLKISQISNNKCIFTYSDGATDNIIINGGTATFEDGASICQ